MIPVTRGTQNQQMHRDRAEGKLAEPGGRERGSLKRTELQLR